MNAACIRRQALHPPIAPEISPLPPPASSPVNTHMETQAAISKAIHPHCHHTPGTRPLSNKLCLTATCYSGQSNNTIGGISNSIYRLTIPYLSTWLLLVQALLLGLTNAIHWCTLQNGICLVDIVQPTGWLGKLPMYTGLLHFLMSFLSPFPSSTAVSGYARALWHRGNTDGRAHLNVFWSSDQYLVWHPVATEHDIWRDTPSASYYFMVVKLMSPTTIVPCGHGCTVASYRADRSSNHNTVFDEIIHCTTCTCGVQH
ncbi:hypothetical protein BX661DRAFT_198335 [Kickxella alabastrina]|uniref:uncharacterized protein n=1 Tax=Kickxella alabastrina TaxID=61397 RepID=UPI00221E61D6|nr:uncharacterized protein BX661DRAFT_198335 [Kickxella alabastrina]KAI7827738.1 hypothetical protein BX661DRAFT_198335 [Kickxella alabastrina]